tara:strand:- start:339 stop:926 length:588 start_codon:yes stop_codon:yes gene_type:complete
MANAKRRCTQCKTYKPAKSMQIEPAGAFCNMKCLMAYAYDKKNKDRLVKIGRKEVDKHHAKQKREFQANDKKLRMKEAVKAFNRFIRLRDAEKPCISCQRHHTGQYHAGHYKPAGVNSALKFNEMNVFKQCAPCNNNLSGNLINYRINLIKEIGIEAVELLYSNNEIKRYTCEELKSIELKYKAKCKALLKDKAA